MSRPLYAADSHVSVIDPADDTYLDDAADYGVEPADGRYLVGIGPDSPDVVLYGSREALIKIARDMLNKLGG